MFVKTGDASLPSLVKHAALGYIISTIVGKLVLAGLVGTGSAISAYLTAPMFLILTTFAVSRHYLTFHCEQTVGCWPQSPHPTALDGTPRACRMPSKASDGGAPLWFLPPPGTHMHHHWDKCIIAPCKSQDALAQHVGFGGSAKSSKYIGKPNVYNCQPLNFEDMSVSQMDLMIQRLESTGVGEEYRSDLDLAVQRMKVEEYADRLKLAVGGRWQEKRDAS